MPDELLIVILCELGERILAMRELLAEPSVAAKPHARAVAALLARGLDALEQRVQRDMPAQYAAGGADAAALLPATLDVLDECARALRALHERLGLLDLRWSAAPVDVFLRQMREDVGAMAHPAVALSDSYQTMDASVDERLEGDLHAAGIELAHEERAREGLGNSIITLPRIEAANPLTWPLLCLPLARLHLRRADGVPLEQDSMTGGEVEGIVAACLGGPAAFAAHAAHALLFAPADGHVWPPYFWSMADAAEACAGGLETSAEGAQGFDAGGSVALFRRLLRRRAEIAGRREPHGAAIRVGDEPWTGLRLPRPNVPSAAEVTALLEKLASGTPINAVDPPLPPDFTARLDAVHDAATFYALIDPLGERPASLAAILGVGWLYKVRYSYPLFRDLLRDGAERATVPGRTAVRPYADVGAALAAYRPHMIQRNELLLQSIEAAHVQGIFMRGKLDR